MHQVKLICIFHFRYKERLRTRYIKSLRPSDTSKFLHGRNWTFVKDGLDDFRDGLPPPIEGGVVLKVCLSTYKHNEQGNWFTS